MRKQTFKSHLILIEFKIREGRGEIIKPTNS